MNIKHLPLLVFGVASFCASCSGKSNDNIFLDKVNEALAKVHVANKVTCHDAINAVNAIDPNLNPTTYSFADKERTFAYDVDVQQFIILKNDELLYAPSGYEMFYSLSVFKFTDVYTANTNFSQYLTDAYPGSETLIIKTGLDMGDHHDIHNIYYENNGESKRILLRTSCDYLNINAPNDEILHFNISNNVFVTAANVYHEYGTSAYTKASSGEIRFEPFSSTDMFEIPVESRMYVSTKTHKDALVFAQINADEVPAAKLTLAYVYDADDLLNPEEGANFFRLANNVTFPYYAYDPNNPDLVNNNYWKISGSVCLDLNGYRLKFTNDIDETMVEGIHPAILVDAHESNTDVNCYILDSRNQLFESSGIYTTDCSIIAWGGPNASANLYMNGGKVTATRVKNGDPAAISIGKYDEEDFNKGYKSNLVMYGGKVVIKRAKDAHPSAGLKCLQPKGAGATLTMVYGNLESDGFCISGMGSADKKTGIGNFGGTYISITGGTFKSGLGDDFDTGDKTYPVLFFPQSGTVDITGGNFYGSSCITVKSGTVNVNGGNYVANGEYPVDGDEAGFSGFVAEGSVMCIDASNKREDGYVYVGGAHINVMGNVKMSSKNSYIAHIRKKSDAPDPDKTASINIADGTFTYHKDKVRTFDQTNYPITVNGGTWTQA